MTTTSNSDWIKDLLPKVRKCIETRKYRITNHAQERQEQHKITLPDLLFVLSHGFHEQEKTLFDSAFQTWKYAIRGRSIDSSVELRVIVAFEDEMAILTIIRLNKKKKK